MKTLTGLTLTLLLVGLMTDNNMAQSSPSRTGTLLILIEGFDNSDGMLLVAVYNEHQKFMNGSPQMRARKEIRTGKELIRFENVPYGHYAVVVLQDLNNDSEMNKNCLGIPTEGYGFSNNVMGTYGPPSFEEASFDFSRQYETQIIDVHYGISR